MTSPDIAAKVRIVPNVLQPHSEGKRAGKPRAIVLEKIVVASVSRACSSGGGVLFDPPLGMSDEASYKPL